MSLPIFDAHLDLAMNVMRGRDVRTPAREQPVVETEIATVGLPDLRAGNVTHICATIFCEPSINGRAGYRNGDEAFAQAIEQIRIYDEWNAAGDLIRSTGISPVSSENHGRGACATQSITLLEGADGVRHADDLRLFHDRGVRIIGLAWHATRYAGGTGEPGPLTSDGRALVGEIDQLRMIHDASHLAEQSFWNLLEIARRPVIASHSNCRAIVGSDPLERHLSDDMIRAIVERGGIVGINFYDRFLLRHDQYGKRRATLADVVVHLKHVCDLAGDDHHVGLGTDMDGGLGREQIPVEIETSADLSRVADALRAGGFDDAAIARVLLGNWAAFFNQHLA